MKKLSISLLILCALSAEVSAQTITVADVEALPGETVAFSLNLAGGKANTYISLQFDAVFPATGFTTTGDYTVSSQWKNATAVIGDVDAQGVATIPVASSEAIASSNVDNLLTVAFTVGSNVALDDYNVTLSNISFGYNMTDKDQAPDVTFKVHVVEKHTVVLDEKSTTMPDAANGVNVRVLRTINAGNWSTICLPFAMTGTEVKNAFGDDVQLGDFDSYDAAYDADDETKVVGLTLYFNSATEIEANHPYVIKVQDNVTEFTVDNVDLSPEDDPCKDFDNGLTGRKRVVFGSFIGTYTADCQIPYEGEDASLFFSSNQLWYASANTNPMKAYRAYLWLSDILSSPELSASRIAMSFDDATGIKSVNAKEWTSDDTYNLRGQRVTKPAKGVYVRKGKIIINK